MTTRKPAFKPGLRDQQRLVKSAMQGMARLHGVKLPEGALSDVKDKQTRGKSQSTLKLEADVQSEVIDFLLRHPRVALVERINSGAVYNPNGSYVQFHYVYVPKRFKSSPIAPLKMLASDLSVTMDDGKRCVIECKREGWTKPCNEREYAQARYLNHIDANKGIGFFAASVDVVRKNLILNGY